ncbi:hypothetical protein HHK36_026474 [Tetracentron sinense]|uniref:glutathione transferase n=1 Tax=Tetracentron sinense TaxID=13715 RepID=A0A834YGW6_TETSI|nr:hypothetical protein HHK36_026474 [Tetracentron sinense]
MTVRKAYGTLSSPATIRVLASLQEYEFEYEFATGDMKAGEHKKEPFISLSPFGEVPVFQDGDLTLFDAWTMMRFISHCAVKPEKEMVFMDPKKQGIVAVWIDVADHQFEPPASKLRKELVEKPMNGLASDEDAVAEEEVKLAKVLDVYEERLTESKYLGAEIFTVADLSHLPYLYCLMGTPAKRLFETRPHVSAWCADIMSRPAWTQVVDMMEKSQV